MLLHVIQPPSSRSYVHLHTRCIRKICINRGSYMIGQALTLVALVWFFSCWFSVKFYQEARACFQRYEASSFITSTMILEWHDWLIDLFRDSYANFNMTWNVCAIMNGCKSPFTTPSLIFPTIYLIIPGWQDMIQYN